MLTGTSYWSTDGLGVVCIDGKRAELMSIIPDAKFLENQKEREKGEESDDPSFKAQLCH